MTTHASSFRGLAIRSLVKVAVRLPKALLPQRNGIIFFLGFCIKFGTKVTLTEAHTLQYIAHHSSIPVPRVYYAFQHKSKTYIVMERVRGTTIGTGWIARSSESKAKLLKQLSSIVMELRKLPAPGQQICNIDGGPILDYRLPKKAAWGPFESSEHFHTELRNGVQQHHEGLTPSLQKLIHFHAAQNQHLPVFTHGDLSSFNILVYCDTISAILDWETSGWLPRYWEYINAYNVNPQNEFWRSEVETFLPSSPEAIEMDEIRRRYFGDF